MINYGVFVTSDVIFVPVSNIQSTGLKGEIGYKNVHTDSLILNV